MSQDAGKKDEVRNNSQKSVNVSSKFTKRRKQSMKS